MASPRPKRIPPSQRPTLQIPPDLDPVYANLVRISHMPSELVFDFALRLHANVPAKVRAQVMMSPLSAKLFYRAMGENLAKYEATYGEIKIPGEAVLQEYAKLFRPPSAKRPNDEDGDAKEPPED